MPTIVYRDGGLDPALLWNPFSLFDALERSAFGGTDWFAWPHFDVEDTEDEAVLTADMPGMRDEDVDVEITGAMLTVKGERKASGRMQRRPYGTFERRFKLADGFDLDQASAQLTDGVLTIRLPKLPKAKPRRIKLIGGKGALEPGKTGVVEKVKGLLSGDRSKKDRTEAKAEDE